MSYLKLVNQTSASKIGAGAGILLSGLLCGGGKLSHLVSIPLGVAGSAIGSRFILTTTTTEMMLKDFDQQKQVVKKHFDGVNPIETDYNIYFNDPIAEKPLFCLIRDYFFNQEKEEHINKFPSTKYFVHDDLINPANPYYLGLDAMPAIGGLAKFFIAKEHDVLGFIGTCGEVAAVYMIRLYINYALYQKGMLNDTEHFELECSRDELKSFKDVLPEALYDDMMRVAE